MNEASQMSKRSKEQILRRLQNAYQKPDFVKIPSSDPVGHIKCTQDSLLEMKKKMSDNKYIVEESTQEELENKINEIMNLYDYKSLIYPSNIEIDIEKINAKSKVCFNEEIENLRKEVFHSDFSIIHARAGISSHGVALVLSSSKQPRMLSLAPKLCIMLLKKENIVHSLSEALALVKKENETLPSNILFIAGPSRTADIELITVFGVHGPQKVHIIVY